MSGTVKKKVFNKNISNPIAGDVHVSTPLTNFSVSWMQNERVYTALRAVPVLPVQKQFDLYYEYSREDLMRDDMEEWADGSETSGSGFTLSTEPYFAKVYGYHKTVTDRQRKNADKQLRLDQTATKFVSRKSLIRRENLMVAAFLKTGIWSTDTVPNPKWDQANADPIADVQKALTTVQETTGYRPNKGLIGRKVYDALKTSDDMLARITGGATNDNPAMVSLKQLAALFELEQIEILDAVFNDAGVGADEDMKFVADDIFLVYYAPDSVDLETPTACIQFAWTAQVGTANNGIRISRYRNTPKRCDVIEGEMALAFVQPSADLGYFFHDILS